MDREQLIAKYESRGRSTGGVFLLDAATALEFIADADRNGLRVLGLDGFIVQASGIQPLQEYELDVEQATDPTGEATAYLRRFVDGGLMFEVALD